MDDESNERAAREWASRLRQTQSGTFRIGDKVKRRQYAGNAMIGVVCRTSGDDVTVWSKIRAAVKPPDPPAEGWAPWLEGCYTVDESELVLVERPVAVEVVEA